ncbi:hypothetical protein [Clostridium thermobutyricum]|uniref:Uncharacterized protein n=1 Tax=Clostridium thermobutyricum DSM 4928 TaxID=1121339 RepID=A0A1V4SZ50_9CLOT|nr:hypothetical protein [Clostridium thermobutyricum]OPX50902.1 hypothetical protein CLTHE_02030 [Clostridium thermobutyricum DSM 4928]
MNNSIKNLDKESEKIILDMKYLKDNNPKEFNKIKSFVIEQYNKKLK